MEIGVIIALVILLAFVVADNYHLHRYNDRLRQNLWQQWAEDEDWVDPIACAADKEDELL